MTLKQKNCTLVKILNWIDMNNTRRLIMTAQQRILLGIFLFLCTGIFFLSCKDSEPTAVEDSSFHFKITVKDVAGNPVNGLRVSAWGILSNENQLLNNMMRIPSQLNKANKILSQSFVNFSLAANTNVFLSAFNIKDQEIDTLINGALSTGAYSCILDLPLGSPAGVYKIRLTASNDTIHFQDSIYAVCHNTIPEYNVFGWTGQTGTYEFSDASLFKKLLELPPFIYTTNSPTSLGTFTYTDSVAVVLTDTATQKQQLYVLKIKQVNNVYNLTWNPPDIIFGSVKQDIPIIARRNSVNVVSGSQSPFPPIFKLYQNYPNPFN
jgi:hypothetical protein